MTDRGQQVLDACHRAVDELETRMLSALSNAQIREFRRTLEITLAALSEFNG